MPTDRERAPSAVRSGDAIVVAVTAARAPFGDLFTFIFRGTQRCDHGRQAPSLSVTATLPGFAPHRRQHTDLAFTG